MKKLILLTLVGNSLLFSEPISPTKTNQDLFSNYLTDAVNNVESARKEALVALDKMVSYVDITQNEDNTTQTSISTQIVKTHAITEIAQNTADVEIAKVKAMAEISKAVDAIDAAKPENKKSVEETSLKIIINAVAEVEIAKAHASKNIVEATRRVEVSKTMQKNIPHEEETLRIAKDISTVQVAKSVSKVEIAKSNSYIDIAKSSISNMMPELSPENKETLEKMKAEATAKISSYLTELEVLKAEIETKIAKEVAKVEIAEANIDINTKK